ncbi:hypothetical protein RHSIM_Rhsim11G0195200 [Rhododendron simsii]|uniref:PRONE domain-containing protein n=1 Tax=Rhododendron simsii TaxID=118357 RepID=A0A834GAY8_RHOSS|nr:hypothetical protein RHSIM_Rhsim11G0195200 [Rhododendron simsii]
MGSVSSEEASDEPCGSYSLSADVSESESECSFSRRPFDTGGGASSSIPSTPLKTANFTFPATAQPLPFTFPLVSGKDVLVSDEKPEKREADLSEYEMMKERFAKLLLGEDMSGGGKGVCTALAISNAITNLSATVFGELWRLEPLASQKKAMWCREMKWLLCVSDYIVELVPSRQQFPDGRMYEVMATRPRSDLYMNLPALKKIDAMLIGMLDGFQETEFWYVDGGALEPYAEVYPSPTSSGRPSIRQEEKWWLPCPKVPPKGLSQEARKRLQRCRDCTSQILKAAMAINTSVLTEMEIPSAYLETLPKTGKACVGDDIYRYITAEQFSPECILGRLDLSSEYHALEVADRIEAAIHVGKQKDQRKHKNHLKAKRSSWGGKVRRLVADGDKHLILAQRAMTLLRSLRVRFPSLPQTALDMSKIQYNKDVGQSILESYSRVMECLAFNVMARIDDVLYVDDSTKQCVAADSMSLRSRGGLGGLPIQKRMSPSPFSIQHTPYSSPYATPTLCSSPSGVRSPGTATQYSEKNGLKGHHCKKFETPKPADLDKLWSYAGNLGSRRAYGDAPERD